MSKSSLDQEAIAYHKAHPPGKLAIKATKPLMNRKDLSLAYSPGVAAACNEIVASRDAVRDVTARGNLVAVISNGTAVLGLGNIGALASKPVMEGKAVLFKRFGNIDVFDLEVDETDVERFCDVVASLEPTFGGINLEDIKAPECFEIERRLKERMNIPVFHDDQHGTAITAAAGLINGLNLTGKSIETIKIVCNGAGSAGIACLNMFVTLGAKRENILLCDSKGVVYKGREAGMNSYKAAYANATSARTLADAIKDADLFIGVSGPNMVTPEMVKSMADKPLIFAMANPIPEILPEVAKAARPDAICATGRSDYPNQINNVLCFPFIFRGALDVEATVINDEMKIACAHAIAELARREAEDSVQQAYAGENLLFSSEMLIPKPFDPRLMSIVPPAVAKAAMDSGVARRPLKDLNAYRRSLESQIHRTTGVMQPIFRSAYNKPKRILFAEGEDKRVLSAVQMALDEGITKPMLVGRPRVIESYIQRLGLRIDLNKDVEVIDPERDSRFKDCYELYHSIMERSGVSLNRSKVIVRTDTTVIAALLLKRKECDAVLCGINGNIVSDIRNIHKIIGTKADTSHLIGVHGVLVNDKPLFIADTVYYSNPTAKELVEIVKLSSQVVQNFDIEPKIAMLSHSNFGSSSLSSATKMREAVAMVKAQMPELKIEGEMQADAALEEALRRSYIKDDTFDGSANLLILPSIESASIAYRLLKSASNGFAIGPMLSGLSQPVHIMNSAANVRGIYNMIAYAVNEVQSKAK